MKSRIQHDFGKAAASYDSHAELQREVARHLFSLTQGMLTADARILDAGCGTGYFHELARSHRYYPEITQLDIAPPMCQLAASYASSPPFGTTHTIAGDCEMLPCAEGVFDGVFSSLMAQWTDITVSSAELWRVLAPQGSLALSTFGPTTLKELATSFQAIDALPHVNRFVPYAEVKTALEQAGFRDIICHTETKTTYYPTVRTLMRELKSLGARYKNLSRKSLHSKRFLTILEEIYKERYGAAQGLPCSWEIYYIIATK